MLLFFEKSSYSSRRITSVEVPKTGCSRRFFIGGRHISIHVVRSRYPAPHSELYSSVMALSTNPPEEKHSFTSPAPDTRNSRRWGYSKYHQLKKVIFSTVGCFSLPTFYHLTPIGFFLGVFYAFPALGQGALNGQEKRIRVSGTLSMRLGF
jgi:hypothetical protein